MDGKIVRYKKDSEYSYTLGMTLTVELIALCREKIYKVFVHPEYVRKEDTLDIFSLCEKSGVPCETDGKIFRRLSTKENVFVIGVFEKYSSSLSLDASHIALINPGDAGNFGTILRTGAGFGFRDFAVVRPGVDHFDPKTIRASMGALFHSRCAYYNSFDEYMTCFPDHTVYSFMLNGKKSLQEVKKPEKPFVLVFGNEAAGLTDDFLDYGESVYIRHGGSIDSLNLAIAAGIAMYSLSDS